MAVPKFHLPEVRTNIGAPGSELDILLFQLGVWRLAADVDVGGAYPILRMGSGPPRGRYRGGSGSTANVEVFRPNNFATLDRPWASWMMWGSASADHMREMARASTCKGIQCGLSTADSACHFACRQWRPLLRRPGSRLVHSREADASRPLQWWAAGEPRPASVPGLVSGSLFAAVASLPIAHSSLVRPSHNHQSTPMNWAQGSSLLRRLLFRRPIAPHSARGEAKHRGHIDGGAPSGGT